MSNSDCVQQLCKQLNDFMTEYIAESAETQKPNIPQCQPIYMIPMCCQSDSSSSDSEEDLTVEKDPRDRYGNFYNNYNIDYRKKSNKKRKVIKLGEYEQKAFDKGVTVGGLHPTCNRTEEANSKEKKTTPLKAIITPSNKNCTKFCAKIPPLCTNKQLSKNADMVGKGCANKSKGYLRVEVDPKEPPCLYGEPCKAQCFNHPPEMRAIHFY